MASTVISFCVAMPWRMVFIPMLKQAQTRAPASGWSAPGRPAKMSPPQPAPSEAMTWLRDRATGSRATNSAA